MKLHIWHAYSTNDGLSNDTKVNDLDFDLHTKDSFFGLYWHWEHCVSQTHLVGKYIVQYTLENDFAIFCEDFREEYDRLLHSEGGSNRLPGVSVNGKYERNYLTVYELMPHSEHMEVDDLFQYTMVMSAVFKYNLGFLLMLVMFHL